MVYVHSVRTPSSWWGKPHTLRYRPPSSSEKLPRSGCNSAKLSLGRVTRFCEGAALDRVWDDQGYFKNAVWDIYEISKHDKKPGQGPMYQNPTLDYPTLDSPTLDKPTLENATLENPTLDYPTLENNTLGNYTLDEKPIWNIWNYKTQRSARSNPRSENSTLDNPTLDNPTLGNNKVKNA